MSAIRTVSVITYASAQRAIEAALTHANESGWKVAAAVCDPSGALIAFARLDGTPAPVGDFAIDKAYTAATLRSSTRAFGERMASRPLLSLGLTNRARVLAWEGGLPIEIDGSVVGGIGVSGAAGDEDETCAAAAIRAVIAQATEAED